jgi:hypothetical protein
MRVEEPKHLLDQNLGMQVNQVFKTAKQNNYKQN